MEKLLEDYKRKLEAAEFMLTVKSNIKTVENRTRLNTKASCYRIFIVDLEQAIERNKLNTLELQLKQADVSSQVCHHPSPYRVAKSDVNYECSLCGKFV